MFGLWKARGARKAAAGVLVPFMGQTRQRVGEIPERVWSDAYVIGFVGTLITLFAERHAGSLGPSALASVQTGAWSDITQTEGVLLGEEICFLSTAGDTAFQLGCQNATSFFEALADLRSRANDAATEGLSDDTQGVLQARLWMGYFDAYLGRGSALGA